jgi:hypothetical protein
METWSFYSRFAGHRHFQMRDCANRASQKKYGIDDESVTYSKDIYDALEGEI